MNTSEIRHVTDRLADPAGLATWLEQHELAPTGVRATRADLGRALELREALHALAVAHNGGVPAAAGACRALEDAAHRARLRLRFPADGVASLEPDAGGVDGALGRLVAIVQASIAEGTWTRLKACREPTCEWAFYDHTKNRSGAWCSMQACGNRAKARSYRERHPDRTAGSARGPYASA